VSFDAAFFISGWGFLVWILEPDQVEGYYGDRGVDCDQILQVVYH
jgi:hypothetical protein